LPERLRGLRRLGLAAATAAATTTRETDKNKDAERTPQRIASRMASRFHLMLSLREPARLLWRAFSSDHLSVAKSTTHPVQDGRFEHADERDAWRVFLTPGGDRNARSGINGIRGQGINYFVAPDWLIAGRQ
jgi:hypothetical protein